MNGADTVLNALVGVVGLRPTVAAIESGKDIALANKEVLVTAGKLIMELAHKRQVRILPVDSEHSAIFQCLQGNTGNSVRAIYLTASGGPFLKKSKSELETVTSADALKHPNWVMGSKITIDSATMMNKGLEVIEALWLFDLKLEQIKVLVHPQSIVHSMVEFEDSAIIAQLGAPDMRLPIQYALAYPNRPNSGYDRLDLLSCPPLSFESPDRERFPCLRLAIEAAAKGGLLPAVMNGANEVAVAEFLNGSIPFLKIPKIIESVMCSYNNGEENYSINDVIDADRWARKRIHEYLNR
jgi:1-deoxy-D-xylulose-5-phosphate reductoisomerase